MKIARYMVTVVMTLVLSSCSGVPKEKLAPCTWDARGACGSIVTLSHQDQL